MIYLLNLPPLPRLIVKQRKIKRVEVQRTLDPGPKMPLESAAGNPKGSEQVMNLLLNVARQESLVSLLCGLVFPQGTHSIDQEVKS